MATVANGRVSSGTCKAMIKQPNYVLIYMILGPFVEGLDFATGTKAEVVGKPEKAFFTAAIEDLQVECNECLMIGDVSSFMLLHSVK